MHEVIQKTEETWNKSMKGTDNTSMTRKQIFSVTVVLETNKQKNKIIIHKT